MSTTTPVSGVPVSLWLPWRPRLIPGRASCLVRGRLAPPGSSHGVSWTISCTDQERRYLSQIPSLAYPEAVAYERITIDPNRMSGLPCIRDTRVTVSAVLGQLAAGRSFDEAPRRLSLPGAGRRPGRSGVRRRRTGTRAAAGPPSVDDMRLLIDANLSPKSPPKLPDMDSTSHRRRGLLTAPDGAILEYAAANALVIVSADTDFGEFLAASPGRARPSASFSAPQTASTWTCKPPS